MTYEERTVLRQLVNIKLWERKGLVVGEDGHGYTSKYRDGCRCDACHESATNDRRRRRRLATLTPQQREAGVYDTIWGADPQPEGA